MNHPPRIEYYGDIKKAATLKGKALGFCDFVISSMYDLQSVQRYQKIDDAVIRVNVSTGAYGERNSVIQIYVPAMGGMAKEDIYLTLSFGSGDTAETYIYNDSITSPRQYPGGTITGGWYWFSKDKQETISWFNNAHVGGTIDRIIVYRNHYLLGYYGDGNQYTMCCAVVGRKLLMVEAVSSGVLGWRMYLKIFTIQGDNINLTPISSRLLSPDYFNVNTFSFDGFDTGYFLIDAKSALLKMGNKATESGKRSVYLVEFNADYSDSTITKAFDGGALSYPPNRTSDSELMCHGDDIILVYDQSDGGGFHTKQALLFYDTEAKYFTQYDAIDYFASGQTELVYTSKALNLTILKHVTYEGGALTADGYPHKFEILVNGVVAFTSIEYYTIRWNFAPERTLRNVEHNYAFDGRRLAVRFNMHLAGSSVALDLNNHHWCIVIDTKNPALPYEILPVMAAINQYSNLSVTHLPK